MSMDPSEKCPASHEHCKDLDKQFFQQMLEYEDYGMNTVGFR